MAPTYFPPFPPFFLFLVLYNLAFFLGFTKARLTFAFIPPSFLSAVIQLVPGAAAPAAVPANDGRAALPV